MSKKSPIIRTLIFIAANVIMTRPIAHINKKNNVTKALLKTLVRKLERENAHQEKIINSQADQTTFTKLLRRVVVDNHRSFETSKEKEIAAIFNVTRLWRRKKTAPPSELLRRIKGFEQRLRTSPVFMIDSLLKPCPSKPKLQQFQPALFNFPIVFDSRQPLESISAKIPNSNFTYSR
ncbi:unnamed protein product [Caenorhabditis nigoni]